MHVWYLGFNFPRASDTDRQRLIDIAEACGGKLIDQPATALLVPAPQGTPPGKVWRELVFDFGPEGFPTEAARLIHDKMPEAQVRQFDIADDLPEWTPEDDERFG